MKTVQEMMETKGQFVWSIDPDASVYEAIRMMAEKEIGALLVMRSGTLVGLVSERDYARKVILRGKSSRDTPVREIMTERVLYVSPRQSAEDCMALMTEKRIRHLPVMDGGRVVGVISIGDLVKSIIAEQRHIIDELERYIHG